MTTSTGMPRSRANFANEANERCRCSLAALLWAYTRVAKAVLVVLLVVPVYTMVSRLYIGAHHVSDVLTAFVYAGLWALLCARMLLPPREPRDDERDREPGTATRTSVAG